jgi:plastocyanin
MKSKPFGALFGLLALVAILGVAPAFGQTANEIDIAKGAGGSAQAACVSTNNCFSPNPLTVAPGTTVTWKNTDTTMHVICSGKVTDDECGKVFEDDTLKPGTTFQFTFANAGTFDYFCSVHPWMTGQVIVGAGGSTTTQATTPNATTTTQATTPNATTTTATPDNATVPEFGPVASIVLAIAVMSMVVFVAKTRGIPKF